MTMAHFITAANEYGVVALCGEAFTTQQKVRMGVYGQECPECMRRAKDAWVTFK